MLLCITLKRPNIPWSSYRKIWQTRGAFHLSELAGRRLGIPLNKSTILKKWLRCYTFKLLQIGANHFQILHYEESLELTLQNFSFYFKLIGQAGPFWQMENTLVQEKISALITIKDWEERVLGNISDGEPRKSSWEFEIGDRELFWFWKFSGELFCDEKILVGTSI